MSQSVDRLKELLFDSEAKTLSDLALRVDTLAEREAAQRAEITKRLESVFDRVGTAERMTTSVADVLDGALRKAEIDRHSELADAVAPLVVRTVKTEIRNSQDELVEALYPVTGRMVKAYVASAMKDLANDINRRLESNPIMLRLRAIASGKSVTELAMAESQQLRVEELYLVRRGSGELIGRWPADSAQEGRDHVMSGILTAINEFSSEALKDEGSALRQIDIGERQLYLRASQTYLLAAKCSGTAPPDVESILDDAFLTALERVQQEREVYGSAEATSSKRAALLSGVSSDLDDKISQKNAEIAEEVSGLSPLKMLAWILGVPLSLWIAWGVYTDYRTDRVQAVAADVVRSTEEMKGYPTRLSLESHGQVVTISGLAPTLVVKQDVVDRLRGALPGSEIRDSLNVLPSGLAEVEPEIAKVRKSVAGLEAEVEPEFARVKRDLANLKSEVGPEFARVRGEIAGIEPQVAKVRGELTGLEAKVTQSATRRALERTSRRLTEVSGDLPRIESTIDGGDKRALVRRAIVSVEQAGRDVTAYRTRAANPESDARSVEALTGAIAKLTEKVRQIGAELSGLINAGMARALASQGPPAAAADIIQSAEDLSAEAERLAVLTVAVSQAVALKNSLPPPPEPVVIHTPPQIVKEPAEPTPRQKLETWVRANAIFFGNGTDYRNAGRAEFTLDALAALMREADALIRVVGYTDDKGAQARNSTLSQERAQKIVGALASRNVPARMLVAVGRLDARDLSPVAGDASPNRRVEFEIGFEGEGAE